MLIMIMGLPGSGKSTFAKLLAQQLPAVYLNSDQIRNCLGLRGQYDLAARSSVYHVIGKAVERHLESSKHIIVDASFSNQNWRDEIQQLALARDIEGVMIELMAEESVVKERLRHKREDSEADFAAYQRLKEEFDPIVVPHLRLDSGRMPLPVMLMKAREHLYSQLI